MNKSKLKVMQVIHTAFCAAIAGFAVVALIMRKDQMHLDLSFEKNDPYFPLFPILAVIMVAVGFYMFNRQIRSVGPATNGDEKIAAYQTAFIIRCAFIEAPALLNTIAFLTFGNTVYLMVLAAVLVVFIRTRPTKEHVIDTTGLQFPDTEKL